MIIDASYFVNLIKKGRRLSEGIIPELIKKLIRNTVNDNSHIHLPSNDDIFTPGWDGCLRDVSIKHRFISSGNSIFELGTKKNSLEGIKKIKSDYETRKNETICIDKKDYTYVAVTTSILSTTSKLEISDSLSKEGVFKKVDIIDANDIVDWLNDHIDICIWFLKQYDVPLKDYDISLLEDEWNYIANNTKPSLTKSIFINGNDGISQKIVDDLVSSSNNRVFCISSKLYGRDYSYFFVVASLINSPLCINERCIIVNSQEGLNFVNSFSKGKIVLVNFNCTDERFSVDLKNTYIFFDSCFNDNIELESVTQNSFIEEVKNLGFDDSEARRISFTVDYNVLALRRLLSKTPNVRKPSWAREKEKNELIPLLLIGEIDFSSKGVISVLRQIVGDNYDHYLELLNNWSEYPESPIFKYDSIYRICARKECFNYLQVDVHSLKIQKLIEFIKNVYKEANPIYSDDKNTILYNSSYAWRNKLIINILNGFIILSDRNKANQTFFDFFVLDLLTQIKGDFKLYLSISDILYYLSELSYSSVLSFFKKSLISDADEFIKFLDYKEENYFSSKKVFTVLNALDNCICEKETVYDGISWLIDLLEKYNDSSISDKIVSILSPISCMDGMTYLSLNQANSFFFSCIKGKDLKIYIPIIKKLHLGGNARVTISDGYSYKRKKLNKKNVMPSEIFAMQNEALRWLLLDDEKETKLSALTNILRNIHTMSFESVSKEIGLFTECIIDFDEEMKRKGRYEVLKTIEHIKKFPSWGYLSKYNDILENLAESMASSDLYQASKDILFFDDFPIENPIVFSENDDYQAERDIRIKKKENALSVLIKKYGQGVIERIIQEQNNHSLDLWNLLFRFSDNHDRDISWMIKYKNEFGLSQYCGLLSDELLALVYEKYKDNELIIKNLPYKANVMKLLENNELENVYWENQYFDIQDGIDYKYVFKKFIFYDPFKLVSPFAYRIEPTYEEVIALLDALSKTKKQDYLKNNIHKNQYEFQELINKVDAKYYTEELSEIEFSLLPYLMSSNGDYPLGIKRYFWNNPKSLSDILIELYKNRENLNRNTIRFKMYYQAVHCFGDSCYIPREYLTQKPKEAASWINAFYRNNDKSNTKLSRYLDRALLIILSSCIKDNISTVWPTIEIANAIEMISQDFDDSNDVAGIFSCAYLNRRGIRCVNDGEAEIALSNEFTRLKDYYFSTHPITSKSLGSIADSYCSEGNNDKKDQF